MENTMFNEAKNILVEMEKYTKKCNKKEEELKQRLLVQEEKVQEEIEKYNTAHNNLANTSNTLEAFEEIEKTTNMVKIELEKKQEYEKQRKTNQEETNKVAAIYSELSNFIKEKEEKYNKSKTLYDAHSKALQNEQITPERKFALETRMESITNSLILMEINIDNKIEKYRNRLPKELIEKLEQFKKVEEKEIEQVQENEEPIVEEQPEPVQEEKDFDDVDEVNKILGLNKKERSIVTAIRTATNFVKDKFNSLRNKKVVDEIEINAKQAEAEYQNQLNAKSNGLEQNNPKTI